MTEVDVIIEIPVNSNLKLELDKKTEIVYHACEWDKNFLGENLCSELFEFLNNNEN